MEPNDNKKKKKADKNLILELVSPKTDNQGIFFDTFDDYTVHFLTGHPGTGKTFIAIARALEELEDLKSPYTHIKIIRSNVSGRDMGHLPGDVHEKMAVFEMPYINIVNRLYDTGTAYSSLKHKKLIEFHSTSFLRGSTIDDCIMIIDEAQNMSQQELFTLLTRVGENCKVIICGDKNQDDLTSKRYNTESGYVFFDKVFSTMSSVKRIQFGTTDIVRSGFVKELIIAYMEQQ